MGKKFQDLTGRVFGRLTVVRFSSFTNARHARWVCLCSCGKERVVLAGSLKTGNTRSCGCLSKETHETKDITPRNAVVRAYKHSAKRRGLVFELSTDDCSALFSKPCHYCGKHASNKSAHENGGKDFEYSGIDRVNNERGYVLDNVVPCCAVCNRAKNTMSSKEFISWCRRVVSRHGED